MNKYIFQIRTTIYETAVIRETMCVVARNKTIAQLGANRLAFDWRGMPASYCADAGEWCIRNEESGDVKVSAIPQYMCRASESELAFLALALGSIYQVKAMNITDEDIIDTVNEAMESGMNWVEPAHLAELFGAALAPRFPAEGESK
jgi:hypothetical protein